MWAAGEAAVVEESEAEAVEAATAEAEAVEGAKGLDKAVEEVREEAAEAIERAVFPMISPG